MRHNQQQERRINDLTTLIQETKTYYSAQLMIAALNEAPGIGFTIAEMKDTLGEISVIVIDGGSTDRTVAIAKNMGARVFFQDGFGKGDALAKGIEQINSNVDYIILTDADYTYPAEYVPEMIKILEDNPQVGMVCGNRLNENINRKSLRRLFHLGNKLLRFAHKILNGVCLEDPLTGLRVIRAEILREMNIESKGFDIEVELNNFVKNKGFAAKEVLIDYRARLGQKKLKTRHGITILKRILKDMFANRQFLWKVLYLVERNFHAIFKTAN